MGKAGILWTLNRTRTDGNGNIFRLMLRFLPIIKYGLGFAPNSWNALRDHLKSKGFTYEQMYEAGLVGKGKSGSYYDAFRNRVMFPIIDLRKNVIGFGGRVLDNSKPKYLNTNDTLVFKKSRNLFSLNFAKNKTDSGRIILAEGYMDVIAQSGRI